MIIFTHHTAEAHSILGVQIAATFLTRNRSLPSIVIGIERNFSKEKLLRFVDDYYSGKWRPTENSLSSIQRSCGATSRPKCHNSLLAGEKVVAFSHLCGRKEIFELAQELKQNGYVTVLGGPQARQDYFGEPDTGSYPHRFKGLKSMIDIAFQGPVDRLGSGHLERRGEPIEHPWTKDIYLEVDWSNLYTFSDTLKKLEVRLGQVLSTIGCPYANRIQTVVLPPPVDLRGKEVPDLEVHTQGCIFCDVSRDKGYYGSVGPEKVMGQIANLPEVDGRKIPFELIDEYPLRSLGKLLEDAEKRKIQLSQINLVCRVDDINAHASVLAQILSIAAKQDTKIMFASIGFESFSERLLQYFCKGISVSDIVTSVETLRRLKDKFRSHLLYRRDEGANHGFIRPTPWDDPETLQEVDRNIFLHRFFEDVLPEHSIPLIIHHASYLGDWIRSLESTSRITFSRDGTWIEWWSSSEANESSSF